MEITVEEWMAELERITSVSSSEGFTSTEIMSAMNISRERVQKLLKDGVQSGRIKLGTRYISQDWDGRSRKYTTYAIKNKE